MSIEQSDQVADTRRISNSSENNIQMSALHSHSNREILGSC